MMKRSLLIFELQYHCRQLTFFIALFASSAFGFFLMFNQSVDSDVLITSPYHLARIVTTLSMLILPFLISAFTGNAIVRDHNAKIKELVFSTPISKRYFLFSRWLGLVLISFLLLLCAGGGMLLALVMMDDLKFSMLDIILGILWPIASLALPGLLLVASGLFAVGLFVKKNVAIYITATIFFFCYQLVLVKTGSILMSNPASGGANIQFVFALLDPFGSSPFFEQVKLWTTAEKNSQFFQLSGMLLFNRLVVLALALSILGVCYHKFSFKVDEKIRKQKYSSKLPGISTPVKNISSDSRVVAPRIGRYSNWLGFLSQLKLEYVATIKTRTFLTVLSLWLVLLISEIISGFSPRGSLVPSPIPGTMEALLRFQDDILPRFLSVLVLFFAAEVVWREQETRIAELVDATPIGNISLFFAKFLALLLIPLSFITITIVASAGLQLFYGGAIDWLVYISLYFYIGIPIASVAALCLFINTISYNKVIGLTCSIFFMILAMSSAGDYIGLEHPLFSFSSHAPLQYSDMIGFSATSDGFYGYMKLWVSLSVLMLFIGYGVYKRGAKVSLYSRTRFIHHQLGDWGLISVVAILISAIYLGYETHFSIDNVAHYQSNAEIKKWRVTYERKYQQYQNMPAPKVSEIESKVDIYPSKRLAEIESTYTLQNQNEEELKEILVSTNIAVHYTALNIENATLKLYDPEHGQYLFTLNEPMQKGETLTMTFSVAIKQNGYLGVVSDNLISPNFTYIRAVRYMPFFGFNPHNQIKSASLREQEDLYILPKALTLEQAIFENSGDFSKDYDWASVKTVISTTNDQIAIAQGELLNQWQKNGRNYYQYSTVGNANNGKIRNLLAYVSGNYAVSSVEIDGIDLSVYYYPSHNQNVQHIKEAMRATVQYANRYFGHYPANSMNLMEVPNVLGITGYALPQMILLGEQAGFRDDLSKLQGGEKEFDQLFRRTAHEVAHQWWGHALNGAAQEGESVLAETLAKYTEMVLLERKYGSEYVRQLMRYEHQRYFTGRARSVDVEAPLYKADANHLIYSKGAIAMYALKDALGEQKINLALKSMIDNFTYPAVPATTLDLISALKDVSEGKQALLVDYWFKGIKIEDFSITSAEYLHLGDDLYQVDVCLRHSTLTSTGLDVGLKMNINLPVNVAILKEHPDSLITHNNKDSIQKLEHVTINEQSPCISWQVKGKPEYVAVDPLYHRLDSNRDNNSILLIENTDN
jgi:ABC-type transport system involved in multi-copper enzyme maturation permease subunit